jgi:excisionase family DNA binding protein
MMLWPQVRRTEKRAKVGTSVTYRRPRHESDTFPHQRDATPKAAVHSNSSPPEPLIDSEEAAAIIGIHPKTLKKMARRGQIRGVHVGKPWRFRASTIEEWIARELAS